MTTPYEAYLASEHWQQTRQRKLEAEDWRCEHCRFYAQRGQNGQRFGLDVHHLTYDRIGREELTDLEALCRTCHAEEHGIQGPSRERARARTTNRINGRLGLDYEPDDEELVAMGLAQDDITIEIAAWDRLAERADC